MRFRVIKDRGQVFIDVKKKREYVDLNKILIELKKGKSILLINDKKELLKIMGLIEKNINEIKKLG